MKRLTLRGSGIGASLVAAALVLAACGGGSDDEAAPGEVQTVTVGTLRGQPHFYHPFLYADHAVEGVEFDVLTLDTTPALNDALVSGTIDFAITGVTPTISSVAQDRDLVIVASAADGGSGFIAGEGIDELGDLVGARVGYLQGASQEVALRLTLAEAGVDVDDLELVIVPVPEMATAFINGDIDAFFGVEIGVSVALGAGGHELADPYATPIGRVNIGLATTQGLIDSDPELVQAVIDTHVATVEYMVGNEETWLTEMINTFGGDRAIFDSAIENFWMRSDLPADYLDQLTVLAEEMAGLGLIDTAPGIDVLVDTSFVED